MFSTLMNELHNTKIAVFGGKPGEDVQFKGASNQFLGDLCDPYAQNLMYSGMAGNQVLEWTDIDTEIKSANLKDVSGMLLCNGVLF